MIATISAIAVSRSAHTLDWRATKFTDGHHQRFVQKTSGIHVRHKCRQPSVQHGRGAISHTIGQSDVMIPGMRVGICNFRPDDLHHTGPSFHQTAREQATLAEGVASVIIPHFLGFLRQIKRLSRTARHDEIQRALIVIIQIVTLHGLLYFRHRGFDHGAQFGAALQTQGENLRGKFEVVHGKTLQLVHVEVVAGRVECVRVERLAKETGAAPFAHHIAFLERTREHHEGEHGLCGGLESNDVGTEVWVILGIGRLQLT